MDQTPRKRGRPRKAVVPPLQQVADAEDLREMQSGNTGPGGSVLLPSRAGGASTDSPGEPVVFPAAPVQDAGRPNQPLGRAVANGGGREGTESIANILRRLLTEPADSEYQSGGRVKTNAEVLAERLMDRALRGDEKVQSMVIDRVEGKAGRSADPKNGDEQLEAELDALAIDEINGL